ncbi:MAG: hypothetical protein G01um101433_146 [Parcubacteria group bacterium Gr01-1014_33]|nr:MAG: hypothetical protein G01um101433_146 [Parcubacteria group bacterium Gr01-1014_33]
MSVVGASIALLFLYFSGYRREFPLVQETHALTPAETNTKIKTLTFFSLQNQTIIASGGSVTSDFSVFVGEQSPVVKNAYIEVEGVTKQAASQTITIDSIQQGTGSLPTPRVRTFAIDSSGKDNPFTILYRGDETTGNDLAAYLAGIITSPGPYTFTIKVDVSGAGVSLLGARLALLYQFTQSAGGAFPATGTVISPTFNTYAVNGATFNSILWKGAKPTGTNVRLQLATSNCPNGETNPPVCSTGTWNYVGGATCLANDYYTPPPDDGTHADAATPLMCYNEFNNKRYFRYKVILCSSSNCTDAGNSTPQVDDVIVNWSP